MRVFIALELTNEIVNEILKIQNLVKEKNFFEGKFTEKENIHLTLKFLGEINEKKVEEVKRRISEIKEKKFFVELGEVGVFSEKFIRIVWVKLEGEGVFKLQREIDDKLKDLFEKENRFMSHITIARVKNVKDKKEFTKFLRGIHPMKEKFTVEEFSLKNSELTEKGPIYTDIERFKLL